MVLCVSCVGARASLSLLDDAREHCAVAARADPVCSGSRRRLIDQHAAGGDGGEGLATSNLPAEGEHGGFWAWQRWLSMLAC